MKHSFHPMGRALCALLLGAVLTLSPLAAQAAPRAENRSQKPTFTPAGRAIITSSSG